MPEKETVYLVRSNFVGGVSVARDPVGTGDDGVDALHSHQRAGHRVADERRRVSLVNELVRRQPGSLVVRPRLGAVRVFCENIIQTSGPLE